jgi:hypothetical protein
MMLSCEHRSIRRIANRKEENHGHYEGQSSD